ncbi:MAG TPA: GTP cyclohydrolase I FolE [Pseudohaliea sp.]|nr:GTP cyclohydrolase I FolE [Pseudohaliea sp.]
MEATAINPRAHVDEGLTPEALAVRAALEHRGLETPMVPTGLSRDEQYARLHAAFTDIAETLGLDLSDDSLAETPHRIAKMYLDESFAGLDYRSFPSIAVIENKMQVDEVVRVDDIELTSTCEHHFVTIDGSARVAYLPRERVIGLSKINRVVRFFARRPQVQERLTRQVLVALQTLLETPDVAVSINAVHYCVKARGVMDGSSSTHTAAMDGAFRSDPALRAEFLR